MILAQRTDVWILVDVPDYYLDPGPDPSLYHCEIQHMRILIQIKWADTGHKITTVSII